MPHRKTGSPYWYASYTDARGKRIRRSTGTTNRREAAALEGQWRAEVHRQEKWGERPRYTFEQLLAAYLKDTTTKKSSERDAYSIKALRPHFGGLAIADISAEHVASYKRHRLQEVAVSTLAKELTLLSTAINHANAEWDWQLPNPIKGRIPAPPAGRIRWITRAEAERLIAAAAQRKRAPYLADMIRLSLHTGLRHRELLNLTWSRVDLQHRLIYLTPDDHKGARNSAVPLNNTAVATLRQRQGLHHQYVFTYRGQRIASIKKSFRAACDAADIDNFTPHDLRHTCASWLAQQGVPLAAIKEVLRHKSIQTTMRYAHLAPENTRAAVAVLDWPATDTAATTDKAEQTL